MDLPILVVEDHGAMRAALADLLRLVYPTAQIAEAECGAQALELARGHPPRLVLLDVALPDANGIDLIAELRSHRAGCRVVMLSQHSAPAYAERALAAGASAYVTKDRMADELLPALERALDAAAPAGRRGGL